MSVKTLAEYLDMTEKAVRRRLERGDLPEPIRAGRRTIRWRRTDIDNWLE